MPRKRPQRPETREKRLTPLGQQLRRIRKARGLSQTELGKLIGVTQRVITYYENEGGSPAPELLGKLATALRVSTDELLGRGKPCAEDAKEAPQSFRLWRRLKRIEELPLHDRKTILKMIDAMADARRKAS